MSPSPHRVKKAKTKTKDSKNTSCTFTDGSQQLTKDFIDSYVEEKNDQLNAREIVSYSFSNF